MFILILNSINDFRDNLGDYLVLRLSMQLVVGWVSLTCLFWIWVQDQGLTILFNIWWKLFTNDPKRFCGNIVVHKMAPILGHGLPSSPSTPDDNWVVMLFTTFLSMLDTTRSINVDNLECFICKQTILALGREMVKPINLKINSWEAVKNGVLVDLMHEHLQAQRSHAE